MKFKRDSIAGFKALRAGNFTLVTRYTGFCFGAGEGRHFEISKGEACRKYGALSEPGLASFSTLASARRAVERLLAGEAL